MKKLLKWFRGNDALDAYFHEVRSVGGQLLDDPECKSWHHVMGEISSHTIALHFAVRDSDKNGVSHYAALLGQYAAIAARNWGGLGE